MPAIGRARFATDAFLHPFVLRFSLEEMMTWITLNKTVVTTDVSCTSKADPNVVGRAPSRRTMRFGPHALHLAAARSSHMHFVTPSTAAPEFQMLARLIEPHVDNVTAGFELLATAASFKDFVGTYFTGTVAAGLACLTMLNEGYVWGAHYEALGGGNPTAPKSPDFAYLGPAAGLALVESKGSGSVMSNFKYTTRRGYQTQVQPHLGHVVGGMMATHGYCIGSWLPTGMRAEMLIHHTAASGGGSSTGVPSSSQGARASILRANYVTAVNLAFGIAAGGSLQRGDPGDRDLVLLRFRWRERSWLTAVSSVFPPSWQEFAFQEHASRWKTGAPFADRAIFAIESGIAEQVLSTFLSRIRDPHAEGIQPLRDMLHGEGEHGWREEEDGAVFPDGLALIDLAGFEPKLELVRWNSEYARFETLEEN